MLAVQIHETLRAFDGFLFGLEIEDRKATDDFLGFAEWAIRGRDLAMRNPDVGA